MEKDNDLNLWYDTSFQKGVVFGLFISDLLNHNPKIESDMCCADNFANVGTTLDRLETLEHQPYCSMFTGMLFKGVENGIQ